ncbi:MAG TPA: hypothetical protein VIT91_06315 [Chthoniobacterales bacterium]
MPRVLNLLLSHQDPARISRMLAYWRGTLGMDDVLLAFGGPRDVFGQLHDGSCVFAGDPRMRTTDHQREKQSYVAVFREASHWMRGQDFTHVYFAEYDHIPLVDDLNERQLARLESERADVLGHRVMRINGTSFPHYLYHASDPDFHRLWRRITCRPDPRIILSMFGSGSFWTREAFDAVACFEETVPIYLEVYLPTLAHHLGFRVRDFGEQNRYIGHLGNFAGKIGAARRDGAWTIHPVKTAWESKSTLLQTAQTTTASNPR